MLDFEMFRMIAEDRDKLPKAVIEALEEKEEFSVTLPSDFTPEVRDSLANHILQISYRVALEMLSAYHQFLQQNGETGTKTLE